MWEAVRMKAWQVYAALVGAGERGQGTSEYAILIGVISILAVVGVLVFGEELGKLLDAANAHMKEVNAWSH